MKASPRERPFYFSEGNPKTKPVKLTHVEDIVGRVYSKLTVLRFAGKPNGHYLYECCCECGTIKTIRRDHLRSGESKSCGCMILVALKNRATHGHTRNGKTSREYRTWRDMIQRCTNPKRGDYSRYGGKGIHVHSSWRNSFEAFYAHMGDCPKGLTLDRINGKRGYQPGNCRWATLSEQALNKEPHPARKRAQEIRSLYTQGKLNQHELAERYGVSQPFISGLVNEGIPKKPPASVRISSMNLAA